MIIKKNQENCLVALLDFAEAVEGLMLWAKDNGANIENYRALEKMRTRAITKAKRLGYK